MTVSILFKNFITNLSKLYDTREATGIAALVFKEKLGVSKTDIALNHSLPVSSTDIKTISKIEVKLLEGYPVQQVLGYADFYGLHFKVNQNVLIPRPETEELVQWTIHENKNRKPLSILDIGTGSGCIAIALTKNLEQAGITAIDISDKALNIARFNAKKNDTGIHFKKLDILEKVQWKKLGQFDIIVSNPPYVTEWEKQHMHINVLNHDPHLALFVADDEPLLFYERISEFAFQHLNPDGKLYFEINEAYGEQIKALLEKQGFKDVWIKEDLNGKDRFASANFIP